MKIIVVGGVAGGASTATRLRRLNDSAEIIMLEKGPYVSFANCGLPYYVGGVIEERESLFVQTAEGLKARYNLDVRVNNEVLSIDRENKQVTIKTPNETYRESYDYLVLSPGAKPFVPNIKGINNDLVFTLRSMTDVDKIKNHIDSAKPKNVTVVGGGSIGLEMVENLSELSCNITLVELNSHLFPAIDAEMTTKLEKELISNNVTLMLNERVEKVVQGSDLEITLSSGNIINSDMIILSAGIRPNTKFIKDSGINLNEYGYIEVDSSMKTNDDSIYAVGDAVQTIDFQSRQKRSLTLAGPASRQARIAANNIMGKTSVYNGVQASFIIKLFSYTLAGTGKCESELQKLGIDYEKSYTHTMSHTGYYPGGSMMMIKLLFKKDSGKILGAFAIGQDGVDKRVDILASAIRNNLTVFDLQGLELTYAPAYSLPKDPVNVAGYVAGNIVNGDIKVMHTSDLDNINRDEFYLIDVRGKEGYDSKHIDGAVNIPLGTLRDNLDKLPKDKKILVNCRIGLTSYLANCILREKGYDVYNLSGGILTYNCYKK